MDSDGKTIDTNIVSTYSMVKKTPLHMTATMGSVGVVRIFMSDFGGFNDQIPSYDACNSGHLDVHCAASL